ncbi:hypothetical protein K431DRAFT_304206 [Polychaeton citri CBS 116435]|uniref:Uncharacterized protein n=1 Tax=Polychaeton citri CBS 116435 TaxID=1314669 RepID=A0A9P4ULV7_9PEZI|nr:hypothetical protein K431DRAFT_304206 [Polychaeton citri CBS 116435]
MAILATFMDHQLTVAEAAAVINVAVVVVKLTYPLLIALVVASILSKQTNVATWSVLSRIVNDSHWPALLRTDTANARKVSRRVRALAILSTVCGLVLAIAAAVTPLGLRSRLSLEEVEETRFSYVRDTSAIGRATPLHATYKASRLCGSFPVISCPGNDDHITTIISPTSTEQSSDAGYPDAHITTGIADNITQAFSSATGGDDCTIAGMFDIEYRSFINYNNQTRPEDDDLTQWYDGGKPRTQGRFRYFQSFILEERLQPIEGLIVSTTDSPGIGFRNHTLPPSSQYGYTWTEEILWLEPETGGFFNLTHDYPYLDLNNTQDDPKLLAKSWKAGVLTNSFLALYMNVSRNESYMGKEYPLEKLHSFSSSASNAAPNRIDFSPFGSANFDIKKYLPGLPGPLGDLQTFNTHETEDFNATNYFYIDTAAFGYGGADPLSIKTAGSGGGLLLGAASMVDADGNLSTDYQSYSLDPGTNWSHPLYSCMSSVKASVKTIDFQLNGTASLTNLIIKEVRDTEYSSQDAMPIWATEDTGQEIYTLSPFWGIVSPDYVGKPGLSTLQRQSFYLPAGNTATGTGSLNADDAAAGARAPLAAFSSLYTTLTDNRMPDFSGVSNWLLYAKWAQLSTEASTAGKITDYIWTDLMANELMSSKSPLSRASDGSGGAGASSIASTPTMRYVQRVSYDWRYAIPALLFVALLIPLLLCAVLLFCTRKLSLNSLRSLLNQSAAGRSVTTERYQGQAAADYANTREWVKLRGDELVSPYADEPHPVTFNTSDMPEAEVGKPLFGVDERPDVR